MALGFKFEPKPEHLKKSKSLDSLKFKKWLKNSAENMVQKYCYLDIVTLNLSFTSS